MKQVLRDREKCPICRKGEVRLIKKDIIYYYKGKRIVLAKQSLLRCPECKEELLNDEMARLQEKNLKCAQREADGLLSAQEIKRIRKKFNMSQENFAKVLDIGKKSLAKYETYAINQSVAMDHVLRLLDRFEEPALEIVMRSRCAPTGAQMVKDFGRRLKAAKKISK